MIGTKAFSSLVMQIVKIVAYGCFASISQEILIYGLTVGAGALFGNYVGKKLLKKLSDKRFKDFVNIMLLITAALIIYKFAVK